MVELSKEEREKIYAEEKARLEARESLQKEAAKKEILNFWQQCFGKKITSYGMASRNQKIMLWVLIGIFAVTLPQLYRYCSSGVMDTARVPEVELKAHINYIGMQFVIRNDCAFDWSGGRIEVNDKFRAEFPAAKAGRVVSVAAVDLADSGGNRFNPFLMKPQSARVTASTPHGKLYNYFTWK